MLRKLPWFLAAAILTSGCPNRPTQADPDAMAERYAHRMGDQECHSWLRSHRTGFLYCASPAFEAQPAPTWTMEGTADEGPCPESKADLAARGKTTYDNVCAACHQADGNGQPGLYPPLAGAGGYYGDAQNHANIIVNGLQGEIQVLGQTYNGVMAPHGFLSDCDIAAVATYERNSWGNDDGIVTVEDVKAVR